MKNPYILSSLVERCSTIDSVLLSTLECFYTHSDCFFLLLYSIQKTNRYVINKAPSFFIRPMVYNASMSHFPPNTSIADMLKAMMIERWDQSLSYKAFYESCAPTHCAYSIERRTKSTAGVITGFISIIGGLSFVLRLIAPYLLRCVSYLRTVVAGKQRRQTHEECEQEQRGTFRLKKDFPSPLSISSSPNMFRPIANAHKKRDNACVYARHQIKYFSAPRLRKPCRRTNS